MSDSTANPELHAYIDFIRGIRDKIKRNERSI